MPPSLGLDASAVLRDAVAARRRRRVVDGVLLALLVVFVWLMPTMALLWAGVAVAASFSGSGRRNNTSALLWAGGIILALFILGSMLGMSLQLLLWQLAPQASAETMLAAGIAATVVFAVLLVHQLVVDDLVWTNLSADRFVPDPRHLPHGFTRTLRTTGLVRFESELRRIAEVERRAADRDGVAEVVAYRGRRPFIGAGRVVRDESLTIPLQRDEDSDEEPQPFTPSDLYEHVDAAILRLRDSASLAPSQRLAELTGTEVVFVPVEQLLRDATGGLAGHIIPDPYRPPIEWMPRENARYLADHPLEIARYVRCYRVEAWDRDIATSTFFHVGTDGRMLFVEWTHCVLFPIHPRYRAIDSPPESYAFVEAVRQAATLPFALLERLPQLFGSLGPRRSTRKTQIARRAIPPIQLLPSSLGV